MLIRCLYVVLVVLLQYTRNKPPIHLDNTIQAEVQGLQVLRNNLQSLTLLNETLMRDAYLCL